MSEHVMHPGQIDIDLATVGQMIARQFPQWADLPLSRVPSAGTDNALFRLGTQMVVRLPLMPGSTEQVAKEQRWLPLLAPLLPLEVPLPLAHGIPGEGYPWDWSIYRWLDGETATPERIEDAQAAAIALAEFIRAMHAIDPAGGPAPGSHNFWRGDALAPRDEDVRAALDALHGTIDVDAAAKAWDAALAAPTWDAPGVWIHGDLYSGNLLARDGRLSAVIDFGGAGVGDPACDVMAAWSFLTADTRDAFRDSMSIDDATWARGKGWALSMALIGLPYYERTNPSWVALARTTVAEVLSDPA